MRTPFLAAAFLMASVFAAAADVRVRVDSDVHGADSIARYIERLGTEYLAPNQKLDITILDYKRSRGGFGGGFSDPFTRPYGFYRGYGYGPRYGWRDPFYGFGGYDRGRPGHLTVQYLLRERGKVIASNIETITSWNDSFGYGGGVSNDRSEVRRWFRKRFRAGERGDS
ncbi:hypothetical protein IZ6_08320 [Terrihabitans soli]|uniref:DUF4136 domain-containing protein n=1 Tax=Terrihabitans soli TaxID=708113 RepID=A0A6S6QQ59_9HYPH|nr:hypothetical protein [Terrihabitans soli]BCJ90097.1 hypothetical protein IZ6_08320 [Terrihabitans soli]